MPEPAAAPPRPPPLTARQALLEIERLLARALARRDHAAAAPRPAGDAPAPDRE